jgi:5'-phosphate synthase pdxT subunit
MIVMAKKVDGAAKDQPFLSVMDIGVRRNAYGRQIDSFEVDLEVNGVNGGAVRAVFIRAPVIADVGDEVEVLATHEEHAVAARQSNMLALAFHPELTADGRIHEYFLEMR